jgi:hypothetical protein
MAQDSIRLSLLTAPCQVYITIKSDDITKGAIRIVVKKIKVKRQPPAEFPKATVEIRVG